MRRWMEVGLWIAVLAMAPSTAWAQPQESSVEERYDAFIRTIDAEAERPRDERVELLAEAYDELFPMHGFHHLGELGRAELDLVFRAAVNAARLVGRPVHVRQVELAFDELLARKVATAEQFSYMQGVYIQARMLAEARRLGMQHPSVELDPVPALREAEWLQQGLPTELVVSPDGQELFRRSVDLSGPAQIVVVAHPRCHFSRNAMLAIEADPILSGAFQGVAKWVTPPDFRFEIDAVRRWNEEHPATNLTLAYKIDEWPELDGWGTPTFYFFRNGSLETKVTGWPKGGRRDELLAALREVGLLPVAE